MTREAVKGMESSKLMDRAMLQTTLPFTRMLAGPAEYTVVMFNDRRRNTSWAHQIASAVVMGGEPMLTYAANPANLLANPAVNIIKDIPAQWDETIVLPGSEIGELAAFARRKGSQWFVAVMNGAAPRKIKISLNFLKAPTAAAMVKDTPGNPAAVQMEQGSFKPSDTVDLDLAPGGGFLMQLK